MRCEWSPRLATVLSRSGSRTRCNRVRLAGRCSRRGLHHPWRWGRRPCRTDQALAEPHSAHAGKQVARGRGSTRTVGARIQGQGSAPRHRPGAGLKATARATKATLITKILETTGSTGSTARPVERQRSTRRVERSRRGRRPGSGTPTPGRVPSAADDIADHAAEVVLGPDGEPLADWEIELMRAGEAPHRRHPRRPPTSDATAIDDDDDDATTADGQAGRWPGRREPQQPPAASPAQQERPAPTAAGHRRFDGPRERSTTAPDAGPRRSGRARRAERAAQPASPCRCRATSTCATRATASCASTATWPSRDDAYIPVKLTRQYGLRKGDHVTGLSRPAGRNEKNPALLEIHTVNGGDPEKARTRRGSRTSPRCSPTRSCASRTPPTRPT